ncbi:MAG: DUF2889 domain-containing protein [Candidatus Desulforudis sp.]|nr:DUF2889 domain-containing protein [Desulforudis sp.]
MPDLVRNRYLTVQRDPDGLSVQTVQCGTATEASARLLVDPHTFVISAAQWEWHRPPDSQPRESTPVPELVGVEAYFQKGASAFRAALAEYPNLARELFIENIRALIQAESFLYAERGYPTLDAYVEYWKGFYRGSCRYYSNPDRVEVGWGRYVGRRTGINLFNRFESLSRSLAADALTIRALLSDSFHEMVLTLVLDPENQEIKRAKGGVLRAPDRVCFESPALVSGLEGAVLTGKSKKEIAPLIGGAQGCVHLINLAAASAEIAAG